VQQILTKHKREFLHVAGLDGELKIKIAGCRRWPFLGRAVL
jgi:hypothetical protein